MNEDKSGARVTIRKRSKSGEGAAVGGAEPVRAADASPGREREEGTLTAVIFYFVPLTRQGESAPDAPIAEWASGRIGEFFGRAPSADAEAGTLFFVDGPWPAPGELAAFADKLEAEASAQGYRCTCETTLRW